MDGKNRVRLFICGNEYNISSQDSEEYMKNVGKRVDEHIRKLMEQSTSVSTTMAAVFSALEFCDEAVKANEAADNLRAQIKDYLEDAAKSRSEALDFKRRMIGLENENAQLRSKLQKGNRA